jgi:4-hydroxy-2-oxoheptanedioate aldolase
VKKVPDTFFAADRKESESMVRMRRSRVLQKLRSGKIAGCVKLNLGDPRAADIAAASGVDCLWIDLEHVPNNLREIENQIRAAKVYDVDTVVRVPRGSYSDLVYPLEMDATGIMVPHVMSARDARQVAWQTRFHPIGRRPIDGGNADGAYCTIPPADYVRQANEERFVVIQIEDPEPVAELDDIAQVAGIDMLLFGPGDFSHAIGRVGQIDDPQVVDAERRVSEAARRHGKFAGAVATLDNFGAKIEMGFQFLSVGADVLALTEYFGRIARAFQAREGARTE